MASPKTRNVVLISLDTLRYDCVGACPDKLHVRAWGMEDKVETPNLDAFLAESLYFPYARAAAPYTTASHATVMTGLYPGSHGVRPFYRWGLAEGIGTIGQELKRRGWRTASAQEGGRDTSLRTGTDVLKGFDRWFREEREACDYCASGDEPVLLFLHTMDLHGPYGWPNVDDLAEKSGEFWEEVMGELRRRLSLSRQATEGVDVSRAHRWATRQARERLDGREAVEMLLDWYIRGVGHFDRYRWPRMVDALKGAGLWDDAMIVVFSDHGEAALPDRRGDPLDHSASVLEDALQVPLAIRAPGIDPEVAEVPVSLADVVPTVLDYLGVEPAVVGRQGRTEGRSVLRQGGPEATAERVFFGEMWLGESPNVTGPKAWRRKRFGACSPHSLCAVRGRLKVLWHPGRPILQRFVFRGRRAGLVRRVWRWAVPLPVRKVVGSLRGRLKRWWSERGAEQQEDSADGPIPEHAAAVHWQEAPTFVIDLAADPLEENPRPLWSVDQDRREAEELLRRMRDYWENSTPGPVIVLEEDQDRRVKQRLRDLGYID